MAEILKFELKKAPSAGQLITPETWQKTDEISTFAEYADAYLQEKKELWKYSTFCAYQSILQNKLIPFFGKLPLDEITGRLVQQCQSRGGFHPHDKRRKQYRNQLLPGHTGTLVPSMPGMWRIL